jgi:SAM-dependent methyltransferase
MEGLPTIVDWWGTDCARRLRDTLGVPTGKSWRADVVIATNVLAHVPDLRDFLDGVREILAPGGTAVFEVPHVGSMLRDGQYDQIYAEHHSYFGAWSLHSALKRSDLQLLDVDHVPVHGGSIRAYASPGFKGADGPARDTSRDEPTEVDDYLAFASVPHRRKREALTRLLDARREGQTVAGYGASAKAATTLAYCGVGPELIDYVADTTPAKWGKWLPGSRIPVLDPGALERERPDVVVNFCWNWREESERNIRAAVPGAEIMYLHSPAPRMLEAA